MQRRGALSQRGRHVARSIQRFQVDLDSVRGVGREIWINRNNDREGLTNVTHPINSEHRPPDQVGVRQRCIHDRAVDLGQVACGQDRHDPGHRPRLLEACPFQQRVR
jgi:hypothetical protein